MTASFRIRCKTCPGLVEWWQDGPDKEEAAAQARRDHNGVEGEPDYQPHVLVRVLTLHSPLGP